MFLVRRGNPFSYANAGFKLIAASIERSTAAECRLSFSSNAMAPKDQAMPVPAAMPIPQPACSTKMLSFVQTMSKFGFSESDCRTIISKDDNVVDLSIIDIKETLTTWDKSQIANVFIKTLILENPQFLYMSSSLLEKRLPLILGHITKNPKTLVSVLLRSPSVLIEKWDHIDAKLNYLIDVMRVDKQDILNSAVLSKTLDHIKLRHTLLSKCGLYKAPSEYEKKRVKNLKSTFRNPPLKRIVDNEDISFARKICKISHEEFIVYKSMFEDELLTDEEDEFNSDPDSGSESD